MIVRSLLCSGIRTLFRCDHDGNDIDDASDDADDDVGDVKDVNFVPILYLPPSWAGGHHVTSTGIRTDWRFFILLC